MSNKFRERGYPSNILTKPDNQPPHPKNLGAKCLPFVNTYHPLMPKIHCIIHRNWPLLRRSYPRIVEFQNPPLMCTKRPPNLRHSLVRADIGSTKKQFKPTTLGTPGMGTYLCLHCAHCSSVIKGDTITHPRTGKRIPEVFTSAIHHV